jgi:hypothetical protein
LLRKVRVVSAPQEDDPLAQLEEWGRAVEREVSRDRTLRKLSKQQRNKPRRRMPRRLLSAAAVAIVVAAVVAVYVTGNKSSPTPQAYPRAAAPSGVTATSGSTPSPSPTASVARTPFDDTPAASWASGASGIANPVAKATGDWSKSAVAADLAKVRSALIASHLDHTLLIKHDPSRVLALLAPATRSYTAKEFRAGRYGVSLVRIAPGAHLATAAPRVRGRTTYRTTTWAHIPTLEIITNYVWVYPFDGAPGGDSTVVVVHSEEHWYFPVSSRVQSSDRGMTLYTTDGYWDAMDCAKSEKGLTAPAPADDASGQLGTGDTESPDDYFQPDHSLKIAGSCGSSST